MKTQFETWWEDEGNGDFTARELCRTAWENGSYCALNPKPESVICNDCPCAPKLDPEDDMDEPLGPACQLGDETCESCQ